jgi:hypothetical protein
MSWTLDVEIVSAILIKSDFSSSKCTLASSSMTSIVFISVEDPSPRWLGVARKLSSVWLSLEKFVLPSSS